MLGAVLGQVHEPADQPGRRVALVHRQLAVGRRGHVDDVFHDGRAARAYDRALSFKDDVLIAKHAGQFRGHAALADVQRAALHQVDLPALVLEVVEGELGVHRSPVRGLQVGHHAAHVLDEGRFLHQPVEGQGSREQLAVRAVGEEPLGFLVAVSEQIQGQVRPLGDDVHEVPGQQLVGGQVEHVHLALGVAADLIDARLGALVGHVEGHHPGVVVVPAVDRPGAQAEDHADHSRGRVDLLVPHVRVVRLGHAGDLRVVELPVERAGDALDEQRHLLVAIEHAALSPVAQGLLAHGAGVNRAHRGEEVLQALVPRALVDAEDALVLAREAVAEGVLQQTAGANQDGGLPEVIEHVREVAVDLRGEGAGLNPPASFFGTL